jgi:hypothetical protein
MTIIELRASGSKVRVAKEEIVNGHLGKRLVFNEGRASSAPGEPTLF